MSHIEVDQSGKIEDLRQDTVVAFSNGNQSAVRLSRKIKRELFQEYRSKIRKIVLKLFAICLFYLLEDNIEKKHSIVICREYWGWEYFIKRELLQHLQNKEFDEKIINFDCIGKKSPAHYIALMANRKKIEDVRELTKENILKYLK